MQAPETGVEAALSEAAVFDFDTVFRTNYQPISRAILRVIGDPARAEDLAVEAFWKLWRHPNVHGEAAGGWVYRAAIRLALDELRRRTRRARYERLLMAVHLTPRKPDEIFFASDEQHRVRAVLATLPPRDAELLLLRGADLSYEEVAAALSLQPGSIGTFLGRARAVFRKEYEKRYGTR